MSKRSRLEIDILKLLDEREFIKTRELLNNYSYKYNTSPVVKILECELQIEEYYAENEEIGSLASSEGFIVTLEKQLSNVMTADNEKESLFKVYEISKVLMLKLQYLKKDFKKCLSLFKDTKFQSFLKTLEKNNRQLLVADAYAIKGICYEKSENDLVTAIEWYERAVGLLLDKLTHEHKSTDRKISKISQKDYINPNTTQQINISSILAHCLNRLSALLLKMNKTDHAVSLFRLLLQATSTQSSGAINLKNIISFKLAVLISRNYSKSSYNNNLNLPSKYTEFINRISYDHVFSPISITQELILLLQVSEMMLNLDPVLDMSPAFQRARTSLLIRSDCLYDLMVVTMLPYGLQPLILSSLYPSLKYTFDHSHLWQQFSLLSCQTKEAKVAISALKESYRIDGNPYIALMIAKKCYEMEPPNCDKGIEISMAALKKMNEMEYMPQEKSRAYLSIGIGKALKARLSVIREEKSNLRKEALTAYDHAHILDDFDYKPLLFSALELAEDRKIGKAFFKVKKALDINPENLSSLHLIALLLTSKKQYSEALCSIERSLDIFPDDPILLSIKCHLQLIMGFKENALQTCLDFFKLSSSLKNKSTFRLESESAYKDGYDYIKGDQSSDQQSTILGVSGKFSLESKTWTKAWLLVAEVYLQCGRYEEVENCLNEALVFYPLAPAIFVIRGRLRELEKNYEGALHLYNLALTSNPTESKAIIYLCDILFMMGNYDLAENLLRNAAAMDVTSHEIWFKLGKVLDNNADYENSVECFNYALQLEESWPIIPFSTIVPYL